MGSLRCFHGMRVGGIFFKSSYKVSFRRSFWLEDILNHKSCCYCDGQDVTNFTKAKFSLGMWPSEQYLHHLTDEMKSELPHSAGTTISDKDQFPRYSWVFPWCNQFMFVLSLISRWWCQSPDADTCDNSLSEGMRLTASCRITFIILSTNNISIATSYQRWQPLRSCYFRLRIPLRLRIRISRTSSSYHYHKVSAIVWCN